jgi:putative ABC transport system ATP-binding protein
MKEAMLRIKKLKTYFYTHLGVARAVDDLDLEMNHGEILGIVGESGCGKTTLLNMIGSLDRRSTGKIVINDVDTSKLSDSQMTAFRRDNIGFIFQLFNLFPFLTAVENVETPLLLRGVNSGLAREQAKMLLRELGMGDRLYHLPSELSGGQQQRVALARALVFNPPVLLMDEKRGA